MSVSVLYRGTLQLSSCFLWTLSSTVGGTHLWQSQVEGVAEKAGLAL